MMTKLQLVAFAKKTLELHTIELCDAVGLPVAVYDDADKLATDILARKQDSLLSIKYINSNMTLGLVGVTINTDGTASFRHFSRAIEHLDPNHADYAA